MLFTSFAVLLPVLFVMALGYWAGRRKQFNADQLRGLNSVVLDYALPALMFTGIARTSRSEMRAEVPFLIVIALAFVGLFLVVLFFSLYVGHRSLGVAALQANLVSFPSTAFLGAPIFHGLFGASGLVSVIFSTVLGLVTIGPLTVVLLEIHAQRTGARSVRSRDRIDSQGAGRKLQETSHLGSAFGGHLSLLNVPTPTEVDNMLGLIGSATGGLSLFLAGLIIANYQVKLSREVIANVLLKMVAQPLFVAVLVSAVAVAEPMGSEAILICAIPTAVLGPLLAPRYQVYETESASTLVLTTLAMIVTLPLAIFLTGG